MAIVKITVNNTSASVVDKSNSKDDHAVAVNTSVARAVQVLLGNGADKLDALNSASGVTAHGGNGSDTLLGSLYADTLNGGNGVDTIDGRDGDDIIIGGNGADKLTGGGGADKFVYLSATESSPSGADTISDFTPGTDKIDLSAIRPATGGPAELQWSGTASSAYGVWFAAAGTTTVIYADVNGDGIADLQINLTGSKVLTAADFRASTLLRLWLTRWLISRALRTPR